MSTRFCEVCSALTSQVCSVCKTTRYCSRECQVDDWKQHKVACNMNQTIRDFEKKLEVAPSQPPSPGRCTGCNLKFDEEDYLCEDACEKCGYQVCGGCSIHTSKGTCNCPNENFGTPYCLWNPRWWHTSGRAKPYRGDRHPAIGDEYGEEDFEPDERACTNCGKVTRMLKRKYCS